MNECIAKFNNIDRIFYFIRNASLSPKLFLAFLLFFFFVSDAYAQSDNTCRVYASGPSIPADATSDPFRFPEPTIDVFTGANLSNTIVPPSYPLTGFVHRFITCIKLIIYNVQDVHLNNINTEVRNAIRAVVTLYIVFFCFRIVFVNVNLRNLRGEVMVVVFTLVGVIALNNVDTLRFFLTGFERTQEAFIETMIRGTTGDQRCTSTTSEGIVVTTPYDFNIWQRFDCTIARVVGALPQAVGALDWSGGLIHVDPYGYDDGSGGEAPDVIFILFWLIVQLTATSLFQGGLIGLVGFSLIFLITAIIAQAVRVYLAAFMAIVVLGFVAPIIIPTILFSTTRNMFNNWIQYMFMYTLQPAVVFAYLAFMFNIMNLMVDPSVAPADTGVRSLSDSVTGRGIDPIYRTVKTDIDTDSDNLRKVTTVAELNSSSTEEGDDDAGPCDVMASNSSNVCSGINMRGYSFNINNEDIHDAMVNGLFLYLLVILLLAAITLSFLVNVIEFGDRISGVDVASPVEIRVFEKAMNKVKSAIDTANARVNGGGK